MLKGIDVSRWQEKTPSLAGLSFAFVRAGYGSNVVDPLYDMHAANIRKAGLVLGAYWFWYMDQDNAKAVETLLRVAGDADLWVLDLEGTGSGTDRAKAQAADFIDRVQKTGRKIGLYASLSGFPGVGQDYHWIAYWAEEPPKRAWQFWQYGSTTIDGKKIDGDLFNGSLADLRGLAGVEKPDMRIIRVKGADFTPRGSGGQIFAGPSISSAKLEGDFPAGTVLRSIAEVEGNDGSNLRLTEYAGKVGYLCVTKPDGSNGWWEPVGDSDVDMALAAFVARQPDPSPYTKAELDSAVKAAVSTATASLNDKIAELLAASAAQVQTKTAVAAELRTQAQKLEA